MTVAEAIKTIEDEYDLICFLEDVAETGALGPEEAALAQKNLDAIHESNRQEMVAEQWAEGAWLRHAEQGDEESRMDLMYHEKWCEESGWNTHFGY